MFGFQTLHQLGSTSTEFCKKIKNLLSIISIPHVSVVPSQDLCPTQFVLIIEVLKIQITILNKVLLIVGLSLTLVCLNQPSHIFILSKSFQERHSRKSIFQNLFSLGNLIKISLLVIQENREGQTVLGLEQLKSKIQNKAPDNLFSCGEKHKQRTLSGKRYIESKHGLCKRVGLKTQDIAPSECKYYTTHLPAHVLLFGTCCTTHLPAHALHCGTYCTTHLPAYDQVHETFSRYLAISWMIQVVPRVSNDPLCCAVACSSILCRFVFSWIISSLEGRIKIEFRLILPFSSYISIFSFCWDVKCTYPLLRICVFASDITSGLKIWVGLGNYAFVVVFCEMFYNKSRLNILFVILNVIGLLLLFSCSWNNNSKLLLNIPSINLELGFSFVEFDKEIESFEILSSSRNLEICPRDSILELMEQINFPGLFSQLQCDLPHNFSFLLCQIKQTCDIFKTFERTRGPRNRQKPTNIVDTFVRKNIFGTIKYSIEGYICLIKSNFCYLGWLSSYYCLLVHYFPHIITCYHRMIDCSRTNTNVAHKPSTRREFSSTNEIFACDPSSYYSFLPICCSVLLTSYCFVSLETPYFLCLCLVLPSIRILSKFPVPYIAYDAIPVHLDTHRSNAGSNQSYLLFLRKVNKAECYIVTKSNATVIPSPWNSDLPNTLSPRSLQECKPCHSLVMNSQLCEIQTLIEYSSTPYKFMDNEILPTGNIDFLPIEFVDNAISPVGNIDFLPTEFMDNEIPPVGNIDFIPIEFSPSGGMGCSIVDNLIFLLVYLTNVFVVNRCSASSIESIDCLVVKSTDCLQDFWGTLANNSPPTGEKGRTFPPRLLLLRVLTSILCYSPVFLVKLVLLVLKSLNYLAYFNQTLTSCHLHPRSNFSRRMIVHLLTFIYFNFLIRVVLVLRVTVS